MKTVYDRMMENNSYQKTKYFIIKHDLAIDDLIQREAVREYGEYHGKAVLAERAGCNVFQ